MTIIFPRFKRVFVLYLFCCLAGPLWGGDLAHTIQAIKPSVVGIGSFQKTRSPAVNFVGTGFVIGDGLTVITNAHVVHEIINNENKQLLGIITGKGEVTEFRSAVLVAMDTEHDLAQLKISGVPLPAMVLADSNTAVEGQSLTFTGFPLGMILGLHHVTHRAIISSITPVVMPALDSKKLDVKMIAQLRRSPYVVFQLDGTAYPGNSGSPLYDPETGAVYGVINMVFVKGLKETAITNPSGITYAIPGKFIRELIQRKLP
jgi:serine protease Do